MFVLFKCLYTKGRQGTQPLSNPPNLRIKISSNTPVPNNAAQCLLDAH